MLGLSPIYAAQKFHDWAFNPRVPIRVGILKEIPTDQGTPFISRLMNNLCRLLKIQQLRTSVYHPQTDGLVKRFNQTLKPMLYWVVAEDGRDWGRM